MNLNIVLRDISRVTGKGNIKISIHVKGYDKTFIPTPYYIEPNLFDSENGIVKKEFRDATKYNADLLRRKERYEKYYEELGDSITNTPPQTLKKLFQTYDNISLKAGKPIKTIRDFTGVIDKIIFDLENEEVSEELKRDPYASTFKATKNLMVEFFRSNTILFQSIDNYALLELKKYFLKHKGKEVTFNKHLRNIRRVFNVAIGEKFISQDLYPFKAMSIPSDYEADIKCLDVDVLRKLYEKKGIGRDFFFLSFFLCGMNLKDIFYMPYFKDYIDIKRLKTARTARKVWLKLRLQPEALEIIQRYADPDKNRLIKTDYSNHRVLTHLIGNKLRETIKEINKDLPDNQKIPEFSYAYARPSWATLAGELRIPDSVIDKSQMRSVTGEMIERYRKYDFSQVDEANRKVIDYTLYK